MVSHVHDEVKVIIEKFKKIITVYLCAGTIVFRKWPPGVAAAIILLSSCPGQTADTADTAAVPRHLTWQGGGMGWAGRSCDVVTISINDILCYIERFVCKRHLVYPLIF